MEYLVAIRKIIKDFMNLEDGQIYLFNQRYIKPNDNRLYICIGFQGHKIISNIKENILNIQKFTVVEQGQISLKVYSYDLVNIDRVYEIIQAINSNECENLQNQLGFYIASQPIQQQQVSEVDGTTVLNCYNLLFNIIFAKRNEKKAVDYDKQQLQINKDN